MNFDTWDKRNGRIERQKQTSRQHERLQAQAGSAPILPAAFADINIAKG
jgi:hypothetical protein